MANQVGGYEMNKKEKKKNEIYLKRKSLDV